ncbi:hypothetical protein O4J55_29400, partial [Paracoccus sp. PXZ]
RAAQMNMAATSSVLQEAFITLIAAIAHTNPLTPSHQGEAPPKLTFAPGGNQTAPYPMEGERASESRCMAVAAKNNAQRGFMNQRRDSTKARHPGTRIE